MGGEKKGTFEWVCIKIYTQIRLPVYDERLLCLLNFSDVGLFLCFSMQFSFSFVLFSVSGGIYWFRPKFNKRVNTILLTCFERNFSQFWWIKIEEENNKKKPYRNENGSLSKNSLESRFFEKISFDPISQKHVFTFFFLMSLAVILWAGRFFFPFIFHSVKPYWARTKWAI